MGIWLLHQVDGVRLYDIAMATACPPYSITPQSICLVNAHMHAWIMSIYIYVYICILLPDCGWQGDRPSSAFSRIDQVEIQPYVLRHGLGRSIIRGGRILLELSRRVAPALTPLTQPLLGSYYSFRGLYWGGRRTLPSTNHQCQHATAPCHHMETLKGFHTVSLRIQENLRDISMVLLWLFFKILRLYNMREW